MSLATFFTLINILISNNLVDVNRTMSFAMSLYDTVLPLYGMAIYYGEMPFESVPYRITCPLLMDEAWKLTEKVTNDTLVLYSDTAYGKVSGRIDDVYMNTKSSLEVVRFLPKQMGSVAPEVLAEKVYLMGMPFFLAQFYYHRLRVEFGDMTLSKGVMSPNGTVVLRDLYPQSLPYWKAFALVFETNGWTLFPLELCGILMASHLDFYSPVFWILSIVFGWASTLYKSLYLSRVFDDEEPSRMWKGMMILMYVVSLTSKIVVLFLWAIRKVLLGTFLVPLLVRVFQICAAAFANVYPWGTEELLLHGWDYVLPAMGRVGMAIRETMTEWSVFIIFALLLVFIVHCYKEYIDDYLETEPLYRGTTEDTAGDDATRAKKREYLGLIRTQKRVLCSIACLKTVYFTVTVVYPLLMPYLREYMGSLWDASELTTATKGLVLTLSQYV